VARGAKDRQVERCNPAVSLTAVVASNHINTAKCTVIENCTPPLEIVPRPKDNPWSRAHGLAGRSVFLYARTLGLSSRP
jgi:colanic acid biosynthesis glycosyl transferase WcaI